MKKIIFYYNNFFFISFAHVKLYKEQLELMAVNEIK